jgi:hypothetical protein
MVKILKLLIEKEREINDLMIYTKIFKLHRAHLIMISDHKEMGIGNVVLGNPPTIEGIKASVASFELFGLGDDMISKIVVERAASYLKTSVLLLFFVKSRKNEENFLKGLVKFLNDILKKIKFDNKTDN